MIQQFLELNTENSEFRNESNLYESNIHPLLRFIHDRDIKPSGWIEVKYDEKHIVKDDKKRFNCDIEMNYIHYENVEKYNILCVLAFRTFLNTRKCQASVKIF